MSQRRTGARAWSVPGSALVALALLACAACGEPVPERLNIVVISLDTLRADALGAYGEQRPTSPAFDRLAASSVVLEAAYSQAPMTAPSHATLFTSLYPAVHRVNNLGDLGRDDGDDLAPDGAGAPPTRWRLAPEALTLAEVLRAAGWRTGAFHGGGQINRDLGLEQGFERFDGKRDNGMHANGAQPFDLTRAAGWIEEHAGEPFFLFLHTYLPHAPYVPPEPWGRVFDRDYRGPIPDRATYLAAMARGDPGPPRPGPEASPLRRSMLRHAPWQFWGWVDPDDPRELEHLRALYAGDVRATDEALEAMLDALERAGVAGRTLIVVLSDHGEGFGEHGNFEHAGPIYREIAHVPLVLRVPGVAPRRIDTPVGLIDLAPTLCELVGLPVPPGMQGRSFAALVRGEPAAAPGDDGVWTEFVPRWRDGPGGPEPEVVVRALRDGRWTCLARRRDGELTLELYDRAADPLEQHDLAGEPAQAERLAAFRARLDEHERACAEARAPLSVLPVGELGPEQLEQIRQLGYAR